MTTQKLKSQKHNWTNCIGKQHWVKILLCTCRKSLKSLVSHLPLPAPYKKEKSLMETQTQNRKYISHMQIIHSSTLSIHLSKFCTTQDVHWCSGEQLEVQKYSLFTLWIFHIAHNTDHKNIILPSKDDFCTLKLNIKRDTLLKGSPHLMFWHWDEKRLDKTIINVGHRSLFRVYV